MNAFLMFADRDFDPECELPNNHETLVADLGLDTLFDAMAGGDAFLRTVAKAGVLQAATVPDGPGGPEVVLYRQHVLTDCGTNREIVRRIYDLAVAAIASEKAIYGGYWSQYPNAVLHGATRVLQMFLGSLTKMRAIADEHAGEFRSEGFRAFFGMLATELDDDYLATIEEHLRLVEFKDGVLLSAVLGAGLAGTKHMLRDPRRIRRGWLGRLLPARATNLTVVIADRDEAGATYVGNLHDRGVNLVANALAQSADHILSFFTMVRRELGFYLACLNAWDLLQAKGEPVCLPDPRPVGDVGLRCRGLYDVCLSLRRAERVVGNDVDADGVRLTVVTGANSGGKSTFLRSVGLAQLMTQAGMFVAANSLAVNLSRGVFTHFKREEDAAMESGKLDEELARMSQIVDAICPGCLLLSNESFASTNEREGSQIAREVIRAMLDSGITVAAVTHLYDLAGSLWDDQAPGRLFLRAPRGEDGKRPFQLIEGRPLPTSFGEDLYERVFGEPVTPPVPAHAVASIRKPSHG